MEVQLSEGQSSTIKEIAEREGLNDFYLETTPGSTKGDNYLGVITKVSVKNHQKSLEFILKSSSKSNELRKVMPIRKVYLREIYLYETIFPKFEEFQKRLGFADGFSGHAKIYGSSTSDPDEFLVLENLKEVGYDLWNRKLPVNAEHARLVFAEYGKFHAISLAMKEKEPELYEKLTENMNSLFETSTLSREEIFSTMVQSALNNGFKAVEGNQAATEAFERFSKVALKFLREDVKVPEDRLVVLHGDCWCNNFLFKYEDPEKKKPTKVCLIDWQLSWTGSPVLDLSYFFFSCCPKHILSDYKRYLKIYHDSLSEVLRNLHCDPEVLFPYSLLEDHWKKYAKYGIYIALMLIKLMLSDAEEVPDMGEIADSGKNFVDGFNFETAHTDTYNQRITDVVIVSGENGWI